MKAQWLYSKSYLFSHTHIRILHIWTTILPHTLTYTYTESYSLTHSIICAKKSYLYYSIKKHVKYTFPCLCFYSRAHWSIFAWFTIPCLSYTDPICSPSVKPLSETHCFSFCPFRGPLLMIHLCSDCIWMIRSHLLMDR